MLYSQRTRVGFIQYTAAMNRRRHIALVLGAILVLGTVVSPLVHFTWMANSDLFMHANHRAHEGHGQDARVQLDDVNHLTCDYSNLFATASAPAPPASAEPVSPSRTTGTVLPASDQIPASPRNRATCPRGPPAA